MKKMLKATAMLFVLGTAAASASATAGDGKDQAQASKVLRDLSGEVIAVYNGSAGTVNDITGEPADGSDIARKIRPGAMTVVTGERVSIIQVDEDGDALPKGAGSSLVSHLETVDADGVLYLSGETVPQALFLDAGIVKNPGPDPVHIMAIVDDQMRRYTVEPGDGVVVNPDQIDLPPESAALGGYICKCDCVCRDGNIDLDPDVRFDCPGSSSSIASVFSRLNDSGNCANFNGDTCEPSSGSSGTLQECTTVVVECIGDCQ